MQLDPTAFVADKELLDALEERSTKFVCEDDRVLFHQGDMSNGLYIVRSGSATVSMASQSGELIVSTAVSTGALLGLPAFIGAQPYSLTATAAKGAEIGLVSREDFSQMMLSNSTLSLKVLSVLAAEVRSARNAISEC